MRPVILFIVTVVLCGCGTDNNGVPCVDDDPSCGRECAVDSDCDPGLFCYESQCAKQCDPSNTTSCLSGTICQPNGRCEKETAQTDAEISDGPEYDAGSSGSSGSSGSNSALDAASPDDICAWTDVRAQITTPTVILIVDQSSSMDEGFQGEGTRWNVLRDFLLEQPGGLIDQLQSQVRFGLALFSARSADNDTPPEICPELTLVSPDLNNYDSIAEVYSEQDPIDETPTGDAIDGIIEEFNLDAVLDTTTDPVVFILATDGEPDRCEEPNPQNGQEEAVTAVENAYGLGIRTFFIWIGTLDSRATRNHVQDVANAGLGVQSGDPEAEYWVAGDDSSLRHALLDIVSGQLSCEISLEGRVEEEDAHLGSVILNGEALDYDDENGWRWVNPTMIRLTGSACDSLLSSPSAILSVSFPCNVEIGKII